MGPKEEGLDGQTRKRLVVARVWPVVVPVWRGILVAVEQKVPIAEAEPVAEPGADASILLSVSVVVIVAAAVVVAASSTPAAVLPTLPAIEIKHVRHPKNGRNTHLHSFLSSLLLIWVE
jgi:hypothetical protein